MQSREQWRSATSSAFRSTAPNPTHASTLSLHDALPISGRGGNQPIGARRRDLERLLHEHVKASAGGDRKSTRLNSSHVSSSYAVFCLKKKTGVLAAWVSVAASNRERSS